MKEQEWLESASVEKMLNSLPAATSDRKLRLFACACCSRIVGNDNLVELAEQFADGRISKTRLLSARRKALASLAEELDDDVTDLEALLQKSWESENGDLCSGSLAPIFTASPRLDPAMAYNVASACTCNYASSSYAADEWTDVSEHAFMVADQEWTAQAALARHIFGNPLRLYPEPSSWPGAVVQLAEAVYNGADAGFALHDALLEAGHPELAKHFQEEGQHPKGCWAVDLILGKNQDVNAAKTFRRKKDQSQSTPASLCRKAAEQGHAEAQFSLANMYSDGDGVSQHYATAAKWYRKAADQGHAKAQLNLAVMYGEGQGVKQDFAKAVQWCRKAAAQGSAAAHFNLGYLYDKGKGVKKDLAQAAKWYRKAADLGDVDAQFRLASMYASGKGVMKDRAEAEKWYRKAAEQGHAKANKVLAGLSNV